MLMTFLSLRLKKDLSQPCYKESIFSDKNKIEGLPSNFSSLTFFFPALKQ